MAKTKFTPGTWYADGDCVASLDETGELVGDVVCMQPTELDYSMEYWPENVRLLAQAKVMYELLKRSLDVRFDYTGDSEAWFASVGEVLEAIKC